MSQSKRLLVSSWMNIDHCDAFVLRILCRNSERNALVSVLPIVSLERTTNVTVGRRGKIFKN